MSGAAATAGPASVFALERAGHQHYSFRSVATGRVCVALCNGLVANRPIKKMWEEFEIELVEGIHP